MSEEIPSGVNVETVSAMDPEQHAKVLAEIRLERERRSGHKMRAYFPDDGPFRRELYPKHIQLFAAGAVHRERLMMAGNRVGKSDAGAYETSAHLTGQYPDWWEGRRFHLPVKAWAAGDTGKTVRDILQPKLLGEWGQFGTGMIPYECIHHHTHKSGQAGAIDTVWVRHVSGGLSTITLKSYAEGRESFQGTAMDLCWLDEEPPEEIYTECVMRTMTTNGLILMTFTPLQGVTPLILQFLKAETLSVQEAQ